MSNQNQTLIELNARLDLVLFGQHEEDHTKRNIAIGVGGLGAAGGGAYAADRYLLQPRMDLMNYNDTQRKMATRANLSPGEIEAHQAHMAKGAGRQATRWQAAKSIGEDYAIGGAARLGKMFPNATRRLLKDGAKSGFLGNIAVNAARAAQAVKH